MVAPLLIAVFTLLWVLIERIGPLAGVPAVEVVFVRYGTHLVFMLIAFAPRHGVAMVRTSRVRVQAVRSLLMFVMPLCFLGAVDRLTPPTALAIFWIAPLLSLTPAWREVRWTGWGLVVVGSLGVLVILRPSGFSDLSPIGVACAVGMAASFACYQHLTHRLADNGTVSNLFHTAFWAFLAFGPLAVLQWRWPSPTGWIALSAVGVLGFFALYALDLALRRAPLEVIAVALFTQPVFGNGAAWILDGVPVAAPALAGSLLVATAVLLSLGSGGTAAYRQARH
jgi:drug/metabolite transporter (DMT)-like permease